MKFNFFKLDLNSILNSALGIVLGLAIAGVGFLVANRVLGVYAYPELSPSQIENIAKEFDRRFHIVSRACDTTHCRGVYDMGGSLYYYSWEFGKSYTIYPVLYERYSTDFSLGDKPSLTYP